jgi:hypothetical protein
VTSNHEKSMLSDSKNHWAKEVREVTRSIKKINDDVTEISDLEYDGLSHVMRDYHRDFREKLNTRDFLRIIL